MAESDALRSLRNYYYLGFSEKVVNEAEQLMASNPDVEDAAEVYLYRSMLESKPQEVTKRIKQKASTALQAVKLQATYKQATSEEEKELVLSTLKEWTEDAEVSQDLILQILAARIFFEEGMYKEAGRLVCNAGDNLEKMSLAVQIYLKIDRLDLASTACRQMQDLDDDDVLTQLASSWVNIASGRDKVTEASFLLQELVEKFGPSVRVLNGLAVCQLHGKNYMAAFQHLKQARDQALQEGQKVDNDTLVNTVVCLQHMRKSDEILAKVTKELSEQAPNHPYLKKKEDMAALFDKQAENYELTQ